MKSEEKPMLLIDVDGCLCPFGRSDVPPDHTFIEHVWFPNEGRSWMRQFSDIYELHWATMWMDQANSVLVPYLGTGRLPYVDFNSVAFSLTGDTYKLEAVQKHIGDRPMVWVDDHLGLDAFQWARERTDAGIPTRLFRTEPDEGIGPHVADILEYGQSISPSLSAAATAPASDLTPSLE